MKNKELYISIFSLMQETDNIMDNIDQIKENSLDYDNMNISNLNKEDEKFYNFLLIFLRSTSDNLWASNQHRLQVYDVIKEQLDSYTKNPDPYTKDRFYS